MSPPLRFGSLFAGIGGFELGLHATGAYSAAWHAEREPFPASVLSARFPAAQAFADVRELTGAPPVDVLAGGFPCQDLSLAGKGAGIPRTARDVPNRKRRLTATGNALVPAAAAWVGARALAAVPDPEPVA